MIRNPQEPYEDKLDPIDSEFFFSAGWWDGYNDGTATSDVGPMRYCGTKVYVGPFPEIQKREGCRHCHRPSVNLLTTYCRAHQDHHEKRMMVYAGTMTEAEYDAWYAVNPAV